MNLLENLLGDGELPLSEGFFDPIHRVVGVLESGHPVQGFADGLTSEGHDVYAADGDGQRGGLQPVAFAVGAGAGGHVTLYFPPDPVGLGIGEAAFEVGDDALEGGLPFPDLALFVGVAHGHGAALGAVENYAYVLFLELPHRDPGGEAVGMGHGLDHAGVPGAHCAGAGPWLEGAFGEGEGLVGKDEVGVNLHPGSEARALGTSAVRAVEGECAGLDLSEADAALDAGEVLGVEGLHAIDDADQDDAVS